MEQTAFLGTGMKFPPQINKSTGRFALSSGSDSVKESIYIILMTHQGERWLVPGFGSRLMTYTFMDMSATMLNIMAGDIRDVLLEQEPRLSDVRVDIDPDAARGCLMINIGYTISATNTPDNMVFPFYLQAARDDEEDFSEYSR